MLVTWRSLTVLPLIHGRLPFALAAREALMAQRFDAVAVELPPSYAGVIQEGIEALPAIHVALRRVVDSEQPYAEFVPIDPGDGLIETLRIAHGERTPVHFVDSEINAPRRPEQTLPDPYATLGLGVARWYEIVRPLVNALPRSASDEERERHMAARLAELIERHGHRPILFVVGLAHWERVRQHLEAGTGRLSEVEAPDREDTALALAHPRSLLHLIGEMPYLVDRYEAWRSDIDPRPFDPVRALKELVLEARDLYELDAKGSMEIATPQALRTLLLYARKLTVTGRRLHPDLWTLASAAKGTVGNEFAVTLVDLANRYPPNAKETPMTVAMTSTAVATTDGAIPAVNRSPGEPRVLRPLRLSRRPPEHERARWRRGFDPHNHCSYPPEDVAIERFRDYVSKRALALAAISLRKTEPFSTSLRDGIALRETLLDVRQRRIHVKEEPPVAGQVGALVIVFEEDDDGTRFPWRTTWTAEHEDESTLAFYSTDPSADVVGPGIGRVHYGGCLFIFPSRPIPDVWEDFRFEQARTPSERLLLAGIFWSHDRFVVHVGERQPSPEIREQARLLHRHVIHLPRSTFSNGTLERLRRAHVLNGREVRSWASRFIY